MKKYLKLLFVATFATTTLSLASCKDDKDEPNGGGGETSFSNMTLKVNGETYYYGRLALDMGFVKTYQMGNVYIENDGTVSCNLVAVEKDLDYNEWIDGYRYGDNDAIFTTLEFDLDAFDLDTAKNGQTLKIKEGGGLYWDGVNRIYQWEYENISSGEINFISYQAPSSEDDSALLILELKNVTMSSPVPNDPDKVLYEAPNTISFSGKVMFTNDEFYTVM
ncbi:MAG: hypothetical protein J1E95_08555 [Muribaculaceae bacterium]|nr:hypothetical protein [Muribaculaceae bacterium]